MTKAHRLQPRKSDADTKPMPLNFLLGCSQDAPGQFELARLAEVAKLRTELHATLDRMIDQAAQAALAGWFRTVSREDLKRRVLQSPDAAIEEILAQAKEEIRNQGRSEEEAENYGKMPMPNIFRPSLPPGAAHLAASIRYAERNLAEGKCEKCPEPLDHNSVRYCTKHLAMKREQDRRDSHRRGKRGNPNLEPGTPEYLYGSEEVPLSTRPATWHAGFACHAWGH